MKNIQQKKKKKTFRKFAKIFTLNPITKTLLTGENRHSGEQNEDDSRHIWFETFSNDQRLKLLNVSNFSALYSDLTPRLHQDEFYSNNRIDHLFSFPSVARNLKISKINKPKKNVKINRRTIHEDSFDRK